MDISVNKLSNTPLYRQIINQLIQQINDGILYEEYRLPSERVLAQQLNINRSTVVRAYDELEAQGFVEKRASSGTFVLAQSEEQTLNQLREMVQYNDVTHGNNEYEKQVQLMIQLDKETVLDGYSGELPYKMIPNISLPHLNWQSFLSEEVSRLGYEPLRKTIALLVKKMYHHVPKEDELMLTAGGQQSLVLLVQVLLKSGDTVAVEDPSFFNGISVLNAMNIKVVRIPVDQDGMVVSELEEVIKRQNIQLVLTNPNFQNPTGTTMSLSRRKQLIHVCQMFRIPIIEDDVFGQLAYRTPNNLPLLKEMNPQSVIYIGSLSKILGSRMQLGWIEAPKYVLEEVVKLRDEYESQLNIFPQVMASYALNEPAFYQQLESLQQTLAKRIEHFTRLLEKELSGEIRYTLPKGGYYIWLTYTKRKLSKEDWLDLLDEKIAVLPSFVISNNTQSCRVNVSRLNEEKLTQFVLKFKKIIEQWER